MQTIVLIILYLLVEVSSFAPGVSLTSRVGSTLRLHMKLDFSKEVGVQAPLGFWDPLGVLTGADQEQFDFIRKAEVKHGRIAMMAVLGHIVTTRGDRLPGEIAFGVPFSSIRSGLAAFEDIPAAGLWQIVLFIGLIEYGYGYQQENIEGACKRAMDSAKWSEAKQRSKYATELNNGRAAQMGILSLMVHEKLDNNPYVLNSMFGAPVAFNH